MKEKTLLILAAGLGSRYGGCKQIDGFGPNKEFIMDYSIYDAIESGFTKVVFLIKRDMLETIENTIAKRIKNKIKVEYAFQEMNNIPSGVIIPEDRVKPWGTAHAIYCCKDVIHEPFVMINADDFYGRESYKEISKYLDNIKSNNIGIVGYKAKNTMSELGSVKRGVCTVKNNKVSDIVESELRYTDGKIEARPLNGIEFHLIDDDTLVSMNMIAFDYSFLKYIDDNIKEFFEKSDLSKDEFLIPTLIRKSINDKAYTCNIINTDAKWCGVTYKEDKEQLIEFLNKLYDEGVYPKDMWK